MMPLPFEVTYYAAPDCRPICPATVDAITGRFLVDVLAYGLHKPVRLLAWRRCLDGWQGFAGRSGAGVFAYQTSIELENGEKRDVALVLKVTGWGSEALFYSSLAQYLLGHVPIPYAVLRHPQDETAWILLEYIPCMSLGPLWEGREFRKSLEGLVALQRTFWEESYLNHHLLPRFDHRSLVRDFYIGVQQAASTKATFSQELRPAIRALHDLANEHSSRINRYAVCLGAQPLTLVHGDFHLANLGTREMCDDALPVITDWSHCRIGPPQIDLVYLLDRIGGLTRKTPSRDELLEDYRQLMAAAGIAAPQSNGFREAITAAELFEAGQALPTLLHEQSDEWRTGRFYSREDEILMYVERCLRNLKD